MKRKAQSARYVLTVALAAWLALPAVPQGAYQENGIASWYGYPYHGQVAASGEVYDMDELTAAHQSLPFNTLVRVVNLINKKTIDVRITDRGPFVDGRIIDLSRAAARSLGLIETGTAPVRLEVVGMPEGPPPLLTAVAARPVLPAAAPVALPAGPAGPFAVQTGAFRNPANAERFFGLMKSRYGNARLLPADEESGIWRVLVGSEATREGAEALAARIRQDSENNAFVVRLDSSDEPELPGQSPRTRGTVVADGLHPPLN